MTEELQNIRRRYEAGELDDVRHDLDRFIAAHRELIRRFRAERQRIGNTTIDDELAVKLYIIKQRSINPKAEIEEQIREIEKEKWIWGVHLGRPPDPQQVAAEWARRYSAGWRAHRVTTIIFLFEQERDHYLAIYRGQAQPS